MPTPENSGITCIVVSRTASALTGRWASAARGTAHGGAYMTYRQAPRPCRRPGRRAPYQQVLETHASFSSSGSRAGACSPGVFATAPRTRTAAALGSVRGCRAAPCARTRAHLRRPTGGSWGVAAAARVDDPDDRSIQPDSHRGECDGQLRYDEGQDVPPSRSHSIGSPLPKRQRRAPVATPRPRCRLSPRVRRTHAGMTASEIRALFAVASRPEVVSLAGGMPNVAALPLDVVGGVIADLVSRAARAHCSTARRRAIRGCASRSAT